MIIDELTKLKYCIIKKLWGSNWLVQDQHKKVYIIKLKQKQILPKSQFYIKRQKEIHQQIIVEQYCQNLSNISDLSQKVDKIVKLLFEILDRLQKQNFLYPKLTADHIYFDQEKDQLYLAHPNKNSQSEFIYYKNLSQLLYRLINRKKIPQQKRLLLWKLLIQSKQKIKAFQIIKNNQNLQNLRLKTYPTQEAYFQAIGLFRQAEIDIQLDQNQLKISLKGKSRLQLAYYNRLVQELKIILSNQNYEQLVNPLLNQKFKNVKRLQILTTQNKLQIQEQDPIYNLLLNNKWVLNTLVIKNVRIDQDYLKKFLQVQSKTLIRLTLELEDIDDHFCQQLSKIKMQKLQKLFLDNNKIQNLKEIKLQSLKENQKKLKLSYKIIKIFNILEYVALQSAQQKIKKLQKQLQKYLKTYGNLLHIEKEI